MRVASRELRDDTAGEFVQITVNGEAVAELGPLREARTHWTSGARLLERLHRIQADPGLREVAVSIVTYGELRAGVLAASDVSARSRRLSTLQTVSELNPLPIDTRVADEWARLRLALATAGRRIDVNDSWIAATALAHDVPLVAQDADFDVLAEVADLRAPPGLPQPCDPGDPGPWHPRRPPAPSRRRRPRPARSTTPTTRRRWPGSRSSWSSSRSTSAPGA